MDPAERGKKTAITIFKLQNIMLCPWNKPATYQTTTLHVFINLSKHDKYRFKSMP